MVLLQAINLIPHQTIINWIAVKLKWKHIRLNPIILIPRAPLQAMVSSCYRLAIFCDCGVGLRRELLQSLLRRLVNPITSTRTFLFIFASMIIISAHLDMIDNITCCLFQISFSSTRRNNGATVQKTSLLFAAKAATVLPPTPLTLALIIATAEAVARISTLRKMRMTCMGRIRI